MIWPCHNVHVQWNGSMTSKKWYSWEDLVLRCGGGSRKRICDELQRGEVLLLAAEFHLGLWATSLPACSSWSSGGRRSWYWRTSCNREPRWKHCREPWTIIDISRVQPLKNTTSHLLNIILSISSPLPRTGDINININVWSPPSLGEASRLQWWRLDMTTQSVIHNIHSLLSSLSAQSAITAPGRRHVSGVSLCLLDKTKVAY